MTNKIFWLKNRDHVKLGADEEAKLSKDLRSRGRAWKSIESSREHFAFSLFLSLSHSLSLFSSETLTHANSRTFRFPYLALTHMTANRERDET